MFNNIIPNVKKAKFSRQNNFRTKSKNLKLRMKYHGELVMRGAENYSHPQLREMQRYGTRSANRGEIKKSIQEGKYVTIEQKSDGMVILVRHSSRYYVVFYDTNVRIIKTFLPDNNPNFLDLVQELMDIENSILFNCVA